LDTAGHTLAFGYDPAGREITRTAGATTLTQTWDANHRLRSQALTTPGAVNPTLTQRRSYTYRADGAVTAIVDQLAGARQFELDPLGRATAVTTAERREQYGYDQPRPARTRRRPQPARLRPQPGPLD
jgi:YD repeat-containing protein